MLFKWEKFQEKGHSPWSVGWSYEHETWKELKKELDSKEKKNIHWKTEQPQALTFTARTEEISNMTGRNAVSDMLEKFPYLEYEKAARINICQEHCGLQASSHGVRASSIPRESLVS